MGLIVRAVCFVKERGGASRREALVGFRQRRGRVVGESQRDRLDLALEVDEVATRTARAHRSHYEAHDEFLPNIGMDKYDEMHQHY